MRYRCHRNAARSAPLERRGGGFRARALLLGALVAPLFAPRAALGVDDENCLMCHRFRGLARVEKDGTYRLFYVDESLFSRGPHARVSCKGCHADIEKIPHDDAKPVDCLRNCHVEEPNREILFSHAGVQKSVEESVHGTARAGGKPLEYPEDLPKCKDCHDEPLFRPVAIHKQARAGVSERALGRCVVCHTDEKFARYFYLHVTTRLHKARDPREVVAMCGTCHGDKDLLARHNLPDSVASYEETFHGKAVMLGSRRVPDCMDCHVREGESVHSMHAKNDPRSSVHAENRAAACSTEECHPGAPAALASFDVHATRNPETNLLEFVVALAFVFLTLAVLLPMLTLAVLGQVRELFPSREAAEENERLAAMAHAKAKREGGIVRFTGAQRIQHVVLVTTFVILCLTGFAQKFSQAAWAPVVLDLFGGIESAPIVHRVAGVVLILGFMLHVVIILRGVAVRLRGRGQSGARAWVREILTLPMFPQPADLRDAVAIAKYVCFLSPVRPRFGRFSWKEKLEYFGLFWGVSLLGVTGFMLWFESPVTRILPGWTLNIAFLIHTYESFLAAAHILLVHLPGVIGKPGASPITGMISGRIPPHVLAEEHGGEIEPNASGSEVQA